MDYHAGDDTDYGEYRDHQEDTVVDCFLDRVEELYSLRPRFLVAGISSTQDSGTC